MTRRGRTGMTPEEVSRVGAEVRDYLRNDAERLTVQRELADGRRAPVFSEREVVHMIDVKRLMARTWDAGWAAFGLLIALAAGAFWHGWRAGLAWLLRAAAAAGGLIVTLVIVLAVVAMVGFDEAFRQFHLLFFTNDLWQLTSADALIQLFPQRFFFDTTLLIGGGDRDPVGADRRLRAGARATDCASLSRSRHRRAARRARGARRLSRP